MAKEYSLKQQIDTKQLDAAFKEMLKVTKEKSLAAFIQIGERFTNDARSNKDYTDRTANLKNSTGYTVKEGKTIEKQDFDAKTGIRGKEGRDKGIEISEKVSTSKDSEIELVLAAGMEYSIHVENNGFQVFTAFLPTATATAKTIADYYK